MSPHAQVEEQDRLIDAALAATIDDGAELDDASLDAPLSQRICCTILFPPCR
jgi:hypothetical protein